MTSNLKHITVLLVIVMLLAACQTDDGIPDQEDNPSLIEVEGPADREMVTLQPPPEWREAQDLITLDNVATADYLGRLDNPNSGRSTVFTYAFSPDGTLLAGLDNTHLIVWDLITGAVVFTRNRGDAFRVYFSSDKTEVYTVDTSATISVFEAESGRPLTTLNGHTDFNGIVTYYADGDLLALGSTTAEIKVWHVPERRSLVTFESFTGETTALAFSEDGEALAVAGTLGLIDLWNWRERQEFSLLNADSPLIHSLAFSPDGAQIAAGTLSDVQVWSTADGVDLLELRTGQGGSTDVLRYSPDGRYIVTAGSQPDTILWDAQTGARAAILTGVGGELTSIAFSPEGALLVSSVRGGDVALWNMLSITESGIARAGIDLDAERVFEVAVSPDGFLMLFFDEIGPVYVWGIPPG